jgi:hypothetical protein
VALSNKWRKSTYSADTANCVEVRRNGDVVEVRNSKDRTGSVMKFTLDEWAAFVPGAKEGQFDL